jgi:hypothetical protein
MPQTEVPAAAPIEASIEWIRDFEERFLDAWNSHQADRVLALMTEDVEYRDDAWPKTMRDHADVREFLDALWTAFPDMTFELIEGPYVIPASRARRSTGAAGERTPAGWTRPGSPRPAGGGRATASTLRSTATDASAGCASVSTCSTRRGSSGLCLRWAAAPSVRWRVRSGSRRSCGRRSAGARAADRYPERMEAMVFDYADYAASLQSHTAGSA